MCSNVDFLTTCLSRHSQLMPLVLHKTGFTVQSVRTHTVPLDNIFQTAEHWHPLSGVLVTFQDHLKECKFKPVQCTNSGCTFKGAVSALEAHLKECEYRLVQCSKCTDRLPYRVLSVCIHFSFSKALFLESMLQTHNTCVFL